MLNQANILNGDSSRPLVDPFGRKMDYLRLAITDRCNLRCQYCMPAEGIPLKSHEHILSFEEMSALVRIFIELGVRKLRITGGEPFVRKDALPFIKSLDAMPELESINITTNAVLIGSFLDDLRDMKIGSLNISLDSFNRDTFFKITRRDDFDIVIKNIYKAVKLNFPVKLNMVVLAGINDSEIIDFANFARKLPIEVRFIEQMPFSGGPATEDILSADQIFSKLQENFPVLHEQVIKNSTARVYNIPGFKGKIGIIAGYSRTFCASCSRLRITPEGILKTCLYDKGAVDLKKMLRDGNSKIEIIDAIRSAVQNRAVDGFESQRRANQLYNLSMAQIGG